MLYRKASARFLLSSNLSYILNQKSSYKTASEMPEDAPLNASKFYTVSGRLVWGHGVQGSAPGLSSCVEPINLSGIKKPKFVNP